MDVRCHHDQQGVPWPCFGTGSKMVAPLLTVVLTPFPQKSSKSRLLRNCITSSTSLDSRGAVLEEAQGRKPRTN